MGKGVVQFGVECDNVSGCVVWYGVAGIGVAWLGVGQGGVLRVGMWKCGWVHGAWGVVMRFPQGRCQEAPYR